MGGTLPSVDVSPCRLVALAAIVAALAVTPAPARAAAWQHASPAISKSVPCGALWEARPHIRHVILIVEENHSYSEIVDHAPYITALARRCGLATSYRALSYPSLPNYVAMTSGRIPASVVHRDCLPLAGCLTAAPNIFRRARSWRVYAESIPVRCGRRNSGQYLPRHTAAPTSRFFGTPARARMCRSAADVLAGLPQPSGRRRWRRSRWSFRTPRTTCMGLRLVR